MARVDFPSRTIFLSVRELAQFASKSFDTNLILENSSFTLSALRLGQKWHQIIQSEFIKDSQRKSYFYCLTELFLYGKLPDINGWNVILRGRLDILAYNETNKKLDLYEIKTTSKKERDFTSDKMFQFQSLSYCWLYSRLSKDRKDDLFKGEISSESLTIFREKVPDPQILLVNTLSGDKEYIPILYSDEEFSKELHSVQQSIIDFLIPRIDHLERFRLIRDIPWFFEEFRSGQVANLEKVRKTVESNPILLEIGPPGSGKTATI